MQDRLVWTASQEVKIQKDGMVHLQLQCTVHHATLHQTVLSVIYKQYTDFLFHEKA